MGGYIEKGWVGSEGLRIESTRENNKNTLLDRLTPTYLSLH